MRIYTDVVTSCRKSCSIVLTTLGLHIPYLPQPELVFCFTPFFTRSFEFII